MLMIKTTNRDEVIAWKKLRDEIKASNLVGVIPIGNRPKPIYTFGESTVEGRWHD